MNRSWPSAILLLLVPAALAHDTWLLPSKFHAAPGELVRVRLATSEEFPSSDSAVSPDRIARFTIRLGSSARGISRYGVDGNFLFADITPGSAGHAIVVAETKPHAFVLEPKVFNDYLQHEELAAVIAARAQRGQTDSPGRERYRKIAKTILCIGIPTDSSFAQPERLWLEIIPAGSTCALRTGASLAVQVLFEGKPLAGAHLAAGYEGITGHAYPVWVVADEQGRATVKLDRAGLWYVRTLHMIPAEGDREADWQSAFSTLTFEVQP